MTIPKVSSDQNHSQANSEMRTVEWENTPLGAPATWPENLTTLLALILHSKSPMGIFWGEKLLTFYNDEFKLHLDDLLEPLSIGRPASFSINNELYLPIKAAFDQSAAGEAIQIKRSIQAFLTPVKDAHNNTKGIFVTLTNIAANESKEQHLVTDTDSNQPVSDTELYLRSVLENAPVAATLFRGPNHVIEIANKLTLQYWRKGPEIIGKPLAEAAPELAAQQTLDMMDDIYLNGGEKTFNEVPITFLEDGVPREGYYSHNLKALYDMDGKVDRIVAIGIDVSRRVIARKLLEESEAFLEVLSNSVPAMIFYLDEDQRYKKINDTFVNWYGVSKEKMIGKTPREFLGEESYRVIKPYLDAAYAGKQVHYETVSPPTMKPGRYLSIVYTPHKNENGKVIGVIVHGTDISEMRKAIADTEKSEERFRTLAEQAPIFVFESDIEGNIIYWNQLWLDFTGQTMDDALGMDGWQKVIHPEDLKRITKKYLDATIAKQSYEHEFRVRRNDGVYRNVLFTGKPRYNREGLFNGYIGNGIDITATIESQLAIRDSEAKIRGILENARAGIAIYVGRDMIIENPNQVFIELMGKGPELVGKPLREVLPELDEDNAPLLQILDEVYTTGKPYRSTSTRVNLVRDGVMTNGFYDFSYTPVLNDDGSVRHIVVAAIEVTEQLLVQQELSAKTREFELAMEIALLGSFRIDLATESATFTQNIREWFNLPSTSAKMSEIISKVHKDDKENVKKALGDSLQGKNDAKHDVTYRLPDNGGSGFRYFRSVGKVNFENGNPSSILGVIQDVTEHIKSIEQSQALHDLLNTAIEGSAIGVFRFRLKDGAAEYSPAYSKIMTGNEYPIGKTRDFFEGYMHPDDHGLRKPIATEWKETNTFHFEPRVIWDDGSSHRILATGSILVDQNGQPITVVGTVRDITEEQKERLAAKEELESKVQQRTHELAAAVEALKATNEQLEESNQQLHHSNDELAQYAFVASHDLQEPLRKIQVFAGLVASSKELPDSVKKHVDKIHGASARMTMLIQDLLTFSRLLKSDQLVQPVPLNETLNAVWNDFELVVEEKSATIETDELPVIEAISLQMNQLFYNLINNALKFSDPERAPRIVIRSELLSSEAMTAYISKPLSFTGYCHITIRDNSVGFESEYADQIFQVFKRLHSNTLYPGSGIGLSICRRIVDNHHGHIYAESEIGMGSVFHIFLPLHQREAIASSVVNDHHL